MPCRDRIVRCLATALERGGLAPADIDYYNAHGTSTILNDQVETQVVKDVFGDAARRLPISSIKGALGHSLGAASAIEAAVSVRALREQLIPPTINYQPDPELDLDYVPDQARAARLDHVLTASFGFGGTNNALILRRIVSMTPTLAEPVLVAEVVDVIRKAAKIPARVPITAESPAGRGPRDRLARPGRADPPDSGSF